MFFSWSKQVQRYRLYSSSLYGPPLPLIGPAAATSPSLIGPQLKRASRQGGSGYLQIFAAVGKQRSMWKLKYKRPFLALRVQNDF